MRVAQPLELAADCEHTIGIPAPSHYQWPETNLVKIKTAGGGASGKKQKESFDVIMCSLKD